MSWLNFNDSLNSLKGQISSFASGVLADGIVNDADPFTQLSDANEKVEELKKICASQDIEINTLRRQNAELYEKISSNIDIKNSTSNPVENGDSWFWDPPSSNTISDSILESSVANVNEDVKHQPGDVTNLTSQITQLEQENEKLLKIIENQKSNVSLRLSEENQDLKKKIGELEQENKELVQNLEQLDLDCQRTTDKLVTLKDNLQSDLTKLKADHELLQNEKSDILKQKNIISTNLKKQELEFENLSILTKKLENEIEAFKNSQSVETKNSNEPDMTTLKTNIENLTSEKNNLIQKLNSTDQLLSDLQKQHENLKSEFDHYRNDSVPIEKHKKLTTDFDNLQNKFTELELKNKNDQEKFYQLNSDFEIMKINDNANLQINLSDDHKKLQDMYEELKLKYESVSQEKKEMHKRYVGILTDNVKKYVDHQLSDEFPQKTNENPLYSEFNAKVEATLKLLLDFKWKTETLEKKLCEISHEKAVAIAEKNHEIEKLLHNSEILSQEVITKTQTIKDYEIECTELIKNNDLLISELQQYKNNTGLQTISESNEDNLLLLETQLDNANKRIRELELIIGDMENAKQDVALETQTELDYIKKQLNMTGKELSQSKKEYQELLKSFKQLEADNNTLVNEYKKLQAELQNVNVEKESYISNLEKSQNDIENIEYKYTESNIERETLTQDLVSAKKEIGNYEENLSKLNSDYNVLAKENNLLINEIDKLKTKIESYAEKLQNYKMSETVLKLQNDTAKKELENLENSKTTAEHNYLKLKTELDTIKEQLKSLGFDVENSTILSCLQILNNKILQANENSVTNNKYQEERVNLYNSNAKLTSDKETLEKQIALYETSIKKLETDLLSAYNKLTEEDTKKNDLEVKYLEKREMVSKLDTQVFELTSQVTQLETELSNIRSSKNELVSIVTAEHEKNVQYYAEIQRLNHIILNEAEKSKLLESQLQSIDNSTVLAEKDTEIEKLSDQVTFLKDKCEKLAQNLLEQQSNEQKVLSERQVVLDREQALAKELERLRAHLVEIEDSYTQELLQAEQRNQEMLTKVNEIEQRERDSSTIYTSVSIRANQQVETLQNQLQLVTTQRDELQKKISDAEDKNNKQFAALTNLQCVLEQFQKDKEIDIANETERIRRQIRHEKEIQNQLQQEINTLKAQLQESKQGLIAASRLNEQLERSKQLVVTMKDEVTTLQDQLRSKEEKYGLLLNQTNDKVDKALVRNLIVGLVGTNNNLNKDQTQILKIISTVLDFSQQDNEKLKLNKPQGSWLNSILHPQIISAASNPTMTQQSLSEAFVRFLESESQPKLQSGAPTLLDVSRSRKTSETSNCSSTKGALLLNEVVLPTFADFAQSRSSSAILKDVLKDNN